MSHSTFKPDLYLTLPLVVLRLALWATFIPMILSFGLVILSFFFPLGILTSISVLTISIHAFLYGIKLAVRFNSKYNQPALDYDPDYAYN